MATKNPIKNPRITEKASILAEGNVYTFDVVDSANKNEIKKAVFDLYKVKPQKVNILAIPRKEVSVRGRMLGSKGGGKKAVVYLKAGDKIELI